MGNWVVAGLFLLEIVQRILFADVFSLFSLQDQNHIVYYFHKQYLRVPAFYLQLCHGIVLANFCIFDNDRHFEVLFHLKFLNFRLFYVSEVEHLFMFKGFFFFCQLSIPLALIVCLDCWTFSLYKLFINNTGNKLQISFPFYHSYFCLAYSVFSHV